MMIALYALLTITVLCADGEATKHEIAKPRSGSPPSTSCNKLNEGSAVYSKEVDDVVWICRKNNEWIPYKTSRFIGTSECLSASCCKEIKEQLTTDCGTPPPSGVYWVQGMEVYCDMSELDGGGWTLVWQHSYMENLPLNFSMRYFSEDYAPCVTRASGWCNIPNKHRFCQPTEQMIVAYHKGTVVYAYKGVFNKNIDCNWSGAILLDFKKIVDQCKNRNNVQPAPENSLIIGLTFDKWTPYDYKANCDSYRGSFSSPGDCRWENCRLPSSISNGDAHVQMTIAIYVR